MDCERAQSINLYFSLKKDEHANLEIVAKSALSFVAALKEAAFVIDPSLEIEVELTRGFEGSLSLEAIIKAVKEAAGGPPTNLKTAAIVCALWVTGQTLNYGYGYLADKLFKNEEVSLSDEEISKIADKVASAMKNKEGEQHIRELFVELQHDDAIDGVGVSIKPGEKPDTIVPRSDFRRRSGQSIDAAAEPQKRTVFKKRVAILVSPVLIDKDRKWKFKFTDIGEKAVAIKDKVFIKKVLSGKSNIRLKGNLEMTVNVGYNEELESGVWVVKDVFIDKVIKYPEVQTELKFDVGHPIKLYRPKINKQNRRKKPA